MNKRGSAKQQGRMTKRTQRRKNYETIIFEVKDAVATITMNRPDKLNACNLKMFREINLALSLVEYNDDVRVVVITGAGDRAFSAGVDFGELDFKDMKESSAFIRADARMFRRIENIPQPVIAAVNGYAFGYGCEIAIVSDITVASDRAQFGLQGVKGGAGHVLK